MGVLANPPPEQESTPSCSCKSHHGEELLKGKTRPIKEDKTVVTYLRKILVKNKVSSTATAVQCLTRRFTYTELEFFSSILGRDLVDRVGEDFVNKNPDGDKVIAVMVPPSERLVVCILAIWKAGFTYLPLDWNQTEDGIHKVVATFCPILIIADENSAMFCKYKGTDWFIDFKILGLNHIWFQMSTPDIQLKNLKKLEFVECNPHEMEGDPKVSQRVAAIFHIFGMGDAEQRPVGVRISHQAIMNSVMWTGERFSFKSNSIASLSLPTAEVDSLRQMFSPILKGGRLYILVYKQLADIQSLVEALLDWRITRITFYLSELKSFLEEFAMFLPRNNKTLKQLKYVFCTELVDRPTAQIFVSSLPETTLVCLLSRAEFCGDVLFQTIKSGKDITASCSAFNDRFITYSECVNNTTFYLLNSDMQRDRDGSTLGTVYISGPQVPMGFVGDYCNEQFAFLEHTFTSAKKGPETVLLLQSADSGIGANWSGKYRYRADKYRGLLAEYKAHLPRFAEDVDKISSGFHNHWRVVDQ